MSATGFLASLSPDATANERKRISLAGAKHPCPVCATPLDGRTKHCKPCSDIWSAQRHRERSRARYAKAQREARA